MHPRNPYRTPLDFNALSDAFPALRPYVRQSANGRPTLDFSDANAQIYLTQALLHRDFGVRIKLTSDRLCPPVPNRLNYILWLQDIVAASRDDDPPLCDIPTLGDTPALASDTTDTSAHFAQNTPILGIDIGTGASAIYPLLGCATDSRWAFVATELDPLSIRLARENISRNGLGNDMHSHVEDSHPRVEILQASTSDPLLLPLATYPDRQFAFTMCNPPFYASAAEIAASAAGKARPAAGARRVGVRQASRASSSRTTPEPTAKSASTSRSGSRQSTPGLGQMDAPTALAGAPVEMVTPGGESAFVARMIAESVQYSERCGWYTSMLGKLASVAEVVRVLKQYEIDNYAITELVQGQTRRWAVGWSFTESRLPDSLARVSSQALSSVLPLRNEMTQPLLGWSASETNFDVQMEATIRRVCAALPGVAIQANAQSASLTIFAASNTWSRAARRKAQRGDSEVNGGGSAAPALVVRVWWTSSEEESPSTHADSMDCEDGSSIIEDAAAEYGVQAHGGPEYAMDVDGPARGARVHSSAAARASSPALHIRWLLGRDRALFETFWSHLARKVDGSA